MVSVNVYLMKSGINTVDELIFGYSNKDDLPIPRPGDILIFREKNYEVNQLIHNPLAGEIKILVRG